MGGLGSCIRGSGSGSTLGLRVVLCSGSGLPLGCHGSGVCSGFLLGGGWLWTGTSGPVRVAIATVGQRSLKWRGYAAHRGGRRGVIGGCRTRARGEDDRQEHCCGEPAERGAGVGGAGGERDCELTPGWDCGVRRASVCCSHAACVLASLPGALARTSPWSGKVERRCSVSWASGSRVWFHHESDASVSAEHEACVWKC